MFVNARSIGTIGASHHKIRACEAHYIGNDMADTSTRVTGGTIDIQSDSKQRVAFDLMEKIGLAEYTEEKESQKGRDYWLTLYRQCLKATTSGTSLATILDRSGKTHSDAGAGIRM